MANRITRFYESVIKRGFAYNNEYSFCFGTKTGSKAYNILSSEFPQVFKLTRSSDYLDEDYNTFTGGNIKVLSEEIQLPGVSTATGDVNGVYQGVRQRYAHSKIYNDINLSFICDRVQTPMRFFQKWFDLIHPGTAPNSDSNIARNNAYFVNYYDDYTLNMIIQKIEAKTSPATNSISFQLLNAWPLSVSAVPLNSGASDIMKMSVTICYERHTFQVNDGLTTNSDNTASNVAIAGSLKTNIKPFKSS